MITYSDISCALKPKSEFLLPGSSAGLAKKLLVLGGPGHSFLSVGTFLSRLDGAAPTANTHSHHRIVDYLPNPMSTFVTKGFSSLGRTSPFNLGN